jgi:adenylate kinase family enzyme
MNKKIYIICGLGSGKSFFAKKLSDKTGIECFDMDRVVFKEKSFEERPELERDVIFEAIIKKEDWILEGTFTEDWIIPGLTSSSQIIYLRILPLVRFYRFVKRIFKQGIFKQNNLYNRSKLVLGFKHKEWDRTSYKYRELLKQFKNKVIILKSAKEIEKYLREF